MPKKTNTQTVTEQKPTNEVKPEVNVEAKPEVNVEAKPEEKKVEEKQKKARKPKTEKKDEVAKAQDVQPAETTETTEKTVEQSAQAVPVAVVVPVFVVHHKAEKKKGIPEELEKEFKFKKTLGDLQNEITTQTKVLKELKSGVKKLEISYQHDINKAVRSKRKKNGPSRPTGFVKELELTKDLADLIGVVEGTKMSMPSYTKEFYKMLEREKLFYENDGRVLRANEQIKKVFGLPDTVNESIDYKDKNGFNFYTLQKHIATVNKARALALAENK